ncbi:T-cell immunomodulatory protein [Halotydeus destructor]|nr:T-cell immunomodulatory protein [Halotydeus destructor]
MVKGHLIGCALVVVLSCLCVHALEKPIRFDGDGLIAAFGDYDSDKLTDVFLIRPDLKTFELMKHYKEDSKKQLQRVDSITCPSFGDGQSIVGLIPGDFHGNATLDVIVVSRTKQLIDGQTSWGPLYDLRLLKGNTFQFDCSAMSRPPFASVTSHPLMMDYNGDMISDLVADDKENGRTVWLGQTNGMFKKNKLRSHTAEKEQPLNDPNSNAFIDLNGDGLADLFFEGSESMEYWLADDLGRYGQSAANFIRIPYPTGFDVLGASSFFDVNGDHMIEHLKPACTKNKCSILYLEKKLADDNRTEVYTWKPMIDDLVLNHNGTDYRYMFSEVKYQEPLKLPITLHHGDIDADGYGDIVTIMKIFGKDRVVLLHNNESSANDLGRTYNFFDSQPSFQSPVLVSLFDLREDSKLDVLTTSKIENYNQTKSVKYAIGAQLNSEMVDANFLKILVASGRCPDDRCYLEGWIEQQYKVNYGTNEAGPFVKYELRDANGNWKYSCAGQLSQSGYFSLQVPYMVFGLGSYANYVDRMIVTIPGGNGTKREHLLEEIVPDAQIILIPHPMDEPSRWLTKLFLTPSDIVFQTLYTLLGMCLSLLFIILILHRRELKEDEKEAKQFQQWWLGTR